MLLVDSHCHLDSLNYTNLHQDVTDVTDKARARDVKIILAVCTTLSGFHAISEMIGQKNNILLSCGIHPLNINKLDDFSELRSLAVQKNVVALGETGLDYHYGQGNKKLQKIVFCEHIRLSRVLNKPIIVHSRNAREDTLSILQEERAGDSGGVLHCFTEDKETAKALLDIGFYISFSGMITFRNTTALREIVRYVPLKRLLVETDSPYLTPVPYRGTENQPAYLRDVAECVATLKGISLTQLATITTSNFCRLFHVEIEQYL